MEIHTDEEIEEPVNDSDNSMGIGIACLRLMIYVKHGGCVVSTSINKNFIIFICS